MGDHQQGADAVARHLLDCLVHRLIGSHRQNATLILLSQHHPYRVGKFHKRLFDLTWSSLGLHLPVRSSHTGFPFSSRNIKVSVPFTTSRARITSAVSCLTLDPVTASSSPLIKLIPISS